MRFSFSILLLVNAATFGTPAPLHAADASYQAARMSARRELAMAKLELRQCWQIEYPRQRRQLNAQIDLTEAEVRAYRERLREYGAFARFTTGPPFLVPLQELRMCLLDAELRLRDLRAERNALVRFHSDQWRLLELRVQEARVRVAELEASQENAAAPPSFPAG